MKVAVRADHRKHDNKCSLRACQSWAWHWVFPSSSLTTDPRSAFAVATISMDKRLAARLPAPQRAPQLRRGLLHIPCVIRLRRICSNQVLISDAFRSYLATATSAPRWSTRMYSVLLPPERRVPLSRCQDPRNESLASRLPLPATQAESSLASRCRRTHWKVREYSPTTV
jgi:hypothetical protein